MIMIKVVGKSFALLEFIATRDGRPALPSEAATVLRLNQATTVRILKDLLTLGYLSQISRNKGYVLGPMTQSVFARNVYREKLMRVAVSEVSQCAVKIGESVILAVLQGARRYVLLHENRNPKLNIDISALYYDDIYLTATGRTLLAHADAPQIDAIVKKIGLPDKHAWPKSVTSAALSRELTKIRQSGMVAFHSPQTDLYIMACPIFEKDECVAALGASFPNAAYSKVKQSKTQAAVREAAAVISKGLAVIKSAG